MNIVSIGKNITEVRILHAKKSLIYFVKNFLPKTIQIYPWQEKIIKYIEDNKE